MSVRIRIGPVRAISLALVRVASVAALSLAVAGVVHAQDLPVRVSMSPRAVRIGQPVQYVGEVLVPAGAPATIKFVPPDSSDAFDWGKLRGSRHAGAGTDTLRVETTLQAFRPGALTVPGIAFTDATRPGVEHRLPALQLTVVPVIAANDTSADLRPVRGPLAPPWWERVPWVWVAAAVALAAAIYWFVRRLLRRRPVAVPVTARAVDPVAAALERLAALRARRLPEAGEFGQHALELTTILRRFIEATTPGMKPGFTTTALPERLQAERVPANDQNLLVGLLRTWDRVKFARAPFTADEARRTETAVEGYVQRYRTARSTPPPGKAAA